MASYVEDTAPRLPEQEQGAAATAASGGDFRSRAPAIVVIGGSVGVYATHTYSTWGNWVGFAAGALVALLATRTLHQAAGKPALQVLAASLMLVCGVVARAIWRFNPWCSALAAVPLMLAGSACLQSQSPRAATQLSKAAFAATIAYATIIAHLFLACKQGAVPLIILLYLAAPLAGAALDSKPFIVLARLLLPQPIAQAVGTHGVLSDKLVPDGSDWVPIARIGIAVVVCLMVVLGWQEAPVAEAV